MISIIAGEFKNRRLKTPAGDKVRPTASRVREAWFSILQRKRLAISDFADKAALAERLMAFVSHWNEHAHPFNWSTKSVAKVMAKCQVALAA